MSTDGPPPSLPPSPPPAPPPPPPPSAPTVPYDEFKKLQLVVGRIVAIDDHPNATKLYVLKVDLGNGDLRQLVAGLKPYYEKDKLLGKRIVVVANLAPAVLRGVESKGMLLAAQADGRVTVLTTDEDMPPGSKIL